MKTSEVNHRSYSVVQNARHGISLMDRGQRLRIDRHRGTASLVGEVREVIEDGDDVRAYSSIWTPVPLPIADEMARSLYRIQADYTGDRHGGRLGWRDLGYDGDVAEWYCHIQ